VRIISWNVNGIRALERKVGLCAWLDTCGADIVGLQEVRACPDQLAAELKEPIGWHALFSCAERRGYSGVALFSRQAPDSVETLLGEERFDSEGRLQIARFGRLVVANVYFPNGSGKERDNSRVPFKLEFYRALFDRVQKLRRGGLRVVVMGDYNTAHRPIDLARPKQNQKTSGFLPEERAELDSWVAAGWVDAFRHVNPEGENYTWWSQRFGVREKNVGWRIDYTMAAPATMRFFRGAFIWPDVRGSDHCPIGLDLDPTVLRK